MATQQFLGIDPGLSGAFAIVTVADDGTQSVVVHETPVVETAIGGGRHRRVYDIRKIYEALQALPDPVSIAYLEEQGARPGQGVTSTFSIGFGYAVWHALLTVTDVPFHVIPPQTWRKKLGLPRGLKPGKAVKESVRAAVQRRFPTLTVKLVHADAVMLAVCAALEHGGVHE